jgi:hypothetical protein
MWEVVPTARLARNPRGGNPVGIPGPDTQKPYKTAVICQLVNA